MKISTILDSIDLGSWALPEFQRGFVWNRKQVKDLVLSLYRNHPVGSLLVWETKTDIAEVRGEGKLTAGSVKLLLDGQQRITSLYGLIRGKAPKFFDGHAMAFTGLFYNLETEEFEFYAPMKMKDNPQWIDVTAVLKDGLGPSIAKIMALPQFESKSGEAIARLTNLNNIKNIDLHVDEVTGDDKTVDIVVDIFNRVNSGGTKLSKGDLALAKICAEWPEARDEMKKMLSKWKRAGFVFKLEWLLRCTNAILTGESLFLHLKDVSIENFKVGLKTAEKRIDSILNLIASRCGLDHDRVLGSRYSIPLLIKYLNDRDGHFSGKSERDKLLYWYIHSFLWGRYAGSTESVLSQDLNHTKDYDNALTNLIEQLRTNRGNLRLEPRDFVGWSKGARFYPLLYMLTRVWHAMDLDSGVELQNHLLGEMSRLEVHHIFPKAQLYKVGHNKAEVNALANLMFLTKETNLKISDQVPEKYLLKYNGENPGVLESQWIPLDQDLWRIENYEKFLDERRKLLAAAANDFLDSLFKGDVPESPERPSVSEREIPGQIMDEDEEQLIIKFNIWITEQGLTEGEMLYELCDQETGELHAVIDLAWPNGVQEGLTQPVALIIDEGKEIEDILNRFGYRFFTDLDSFKAYVNDVILA